MENNIDKTEQYIKNLLKMNDNLIIAVDGRCGAGKTTFAEQLKSKFNCNVIHMDDFFLRAEQRTEERLDTPGGNVDYERFSTEVIIPLKNCESFSYRPYLCHNQSFGDAISVKHNKITLVEGSYSCHPSLWDFYDLHIFMDIAADEQMQRIIGRNGRAAAEQFRNKWIPLEEKYFSAYKIKENCEIVL